MGRVERIKDSEESLRGRGILKSISCRPQRHAMHSFLLCSLSTYSSSTFLVSAISSACAPERERKERSLHRHVREYRILACHMYQGATAAALEVVPPNIDPLVSNI